MIKFNKHYVTSGTDKAHVYYGMDNRTDGRKCVTLYAKNYGHALGRIFADEYVNNSDSMTDFFRKGCVVLFEDHPSYAAARERAEKNERDREAKYAAFVTKCHA